MSFFLGLEGCEASGLRSLRDFMPKPTVDLDLPEWWMFAIPPSIAAAALGVRHIGTARNILQEGGVKSCLAGERVHVYDSRDVVALISRRNGRNLIDETVTNVNETFALEGFPGTDGYRGNIVEDARHTRYWFGRNAIMPLTHAVRFIKRAPQKATIYFPNREEFEERLRKIKENRK